MNKYLLLLLLFTSMAYAQDWGSEHRSDTSYLPKISYQQDLEKFGLLILVKYYQMYERECWADSTEESYVDSLYPFTHLTQFQTNGQWDDWKFEEWKRKTRFWVHTWTHREPTFQGFMEFIKREVKK